MHTIQYVAVQADSVDEAFDRVKQNLESQLGDGENINTWYDWFVTGGGRWASDESAQYDDNYKGDVVHQSSPKFQEYLDKAKEFRQASLNEYLADIRKMNVELVLDNIEVSAGDDFKSGMLLYPFSQLYNITMGTWNYNSYFYDVTNDTASMVSLKNSIDNGADSWYLVPVDFHF
jgi:hypothetical protein